MPTTTGHDAPYPERRRLHENAFDRQCSIAWGKLAARLPGRQARLERFAEQVAALEKNFAHLTEAELAAGVDETRRRLVREGATPRMAGRVFATVREVTRRRLGMFHHPVQLMGGWAMLNGNIIEMATGEGKTITALLPAITSALAGAPVHVITVNGYLASRDAERLAPVYEAFGLRVGLVRHGQSPDERRLAYAADVTYCTNQDLGFDYLKDRLAVGQSRSMVQRAGLDLIGTAQRGTLLRGLHFGIIDEADSILIDEARTPLIISGPSRDLLPETIYAEALDVAAQLRPGIDYAERLKERVVRLTDGGRDRVDDLAAGRGGLWAARRAREEMVTQALSALRLFHKDRQYIVADGKVQIVDEFTGRVTPDRSWELGLHQMIEVKEGCPITAIRQPMARITYNSLFRRYLKLAGMSGTIVEVAGEIKADFDVAVIRIRTHRPSRRRNLGARIYARAADKWASVIEATRGMKARGRPILIGTRSVAASEELSRQLSASGVEHTVLNARQDSTEADIIAEAGRPGRVTVATNMAGRGTDILLAPGVAEAGGLHVILTEYHESSRIDRQLFGRSARQGDPGSYEVIASLEDELFKSPSGSSISRLGLAFPRGGKPLPAALANSLRRTAQARAEKRNAKARLAAVRAEREQQRRLAMTGMSE